MRLFKNRKFIVIFVTFIILIGLFAFFSWQNNSITVNKITFTSEKVPEAFNGYRILHISDLHNKKFGNNQKNLLSEIKQLEPNIIVITGDLIGSNNPDIEIAMDFIKGAIDIAPVCFVSGNHENWSGLYDSLKSQMEEEGVKVLDNQRAEISKGDSSIDIIGLPDYSFVQEHGDNARNLLDSLIESDDRLTILLSHRPELFDVYSSAGVDLAFTGHAHGGQFRLPFVGGLIAPDQGFLPQLTEGIHTDKNTSIVISRGIGNSVIPVRIFNRPELIVVTLSKT